jgi:hypothetical protein
MSHCELMLQKYGFQVRREKISERMKVLQQLVPGCDKVNDSLFNLYGVLLIWDIGYVLLFHRHQTQRCY